jgi:hypothetical protein
MNTVLVVVIAAGATLLPAAAHAGELDLNLGLQATTTEWPEDHGGGGSLDLGYWFTDRFGVSFVGKEQYATIDQRLMSYLSLNGAVRQDLGTMHLVGMLGVVHQHEETRAALMDAPVSALLGIGDGIRHRAGARAGVSLIVPILQHRRGEWYLAFALDTTVFSEAERGPQWMASGGVSLGLTFDVTRSAAVAP